MKTCFVSFVLMLLGVSNIARADEFRVTPEWLLAHLKDSDLVILDTRSPEDYGKGHLSGAINLPDTLTYQMKSESGTVVSPDVMQVVLRERGIDQNKLVVIYDAGQLLDAARVFWVLEVYGLQRLKILSPGYNAWVKQALPISTEIPTPHPSEYVPTINHKRIAGKLAVQLATENPEQVVIDARDTDSYHGKKSSARRFGHIPTAKNYPASDNLEERGGALVLRDRASIEREFSSIPKGKKVILYCEIGRASAANYLVLRELGYDVSNYDGSWREWGNDLTLPIE